MSMGERMKRLWSRLRAPLPARERGIALILVLGTVAVLTVSIVQFVYDTRVNLHLAQNQRDEVKAYFLAKSGINLQRLALSYQFELADKASSGDMLGRAAKNGKFQLWRYLDLFLPIVTKGEFKTPIGGVDFNSLGGEGFGGLTGEIEFNNPVSENGKVSINSLAKSPLPQDTAAALCALFRPMAFAAPQNRDAREDARERYELVAAIIDHVDPDSDMTILDENCVASRGGAGNESSRYADLEWGPLNEPLLSLDGLLQVPGMTPELFESVRDHLTIYDTQAYLYANMAKDIDWFSWLCNHIQGAPPGYNPCVTDLSVATTVLYQTLALDGRVRFFENPMQVLMLMLSGQQAPGGEDITRDLSRMMAFGNPDAVIGFVNETLTRNPTAGAFWAQYARPRPEMAAAAMTLGWTPAYFSMLLQGQATAPQLAPVAYDTNAMRSLVRTDTPKIYTVTAKGRYGQATRELRTVVDFNRDGRFLYWSEN